MSNKFEEIIKVIKEKDSFLITSHVGPDGDSLGSSLGLKLILESLGKKGIVVIDDLIPKTFSFLPDIDKVLRYEEGMELEFDAAFILDAGDIKRVGEVEGLIGDKVMVNIDHHGDNPSFGDYNLVEEAAATAQLIYDLIEEIGGVKVNNNIATALATGLITDTGSFKYANTTAKTHRIMGQLLEYDVDTAKICKEVFDTHSYEELMLRAKALDSMEINRDLKVAWLKISQSLLEEAGAKLDDTGGLVNYPRSLEGIEVALIFKEVEETLVRVSLRSNEYFPVDQLAHKFGGGGHPRAAGCSIEESLEEAQKLMIKAIGEMVGDISEGNS
ncbi:DHH family phosphoesterase [Halonatronum saccharophilum]|uniref:DHH family phosphoesterase n=1 Tax=Halonatronum saccharophilum TaxID=150060 RepID=UPI0004BA5838|nr:bifunctional oligoribonuclease/PAP phosphatase NrnA [Halonatronum saccharophilum]